MEEKKITDTPDFRTEKARLLYEEIMALSQEEKDDFFLHMGKMLDHALAENIVRKWFDTDAEINPDAQDKEEFIRVMSEKMTHEGPTDKEFARAYRAANRTIIGTISGLEDMNYYLSRMGLRKNDTIVITGYDRSHALVYTGSISYDASVLSFRLKSIREIYGDSIDSMIFIMNDRSLYEDMERKLAKALLKKLSLALRSVGYRTEDILVSNGTELLSCRQCSRM